MRKLALLLIGLLFPAPVLGQSVEELAIELTVPWAFVFAPDGRIFFNERAGLVRVINADGQLQVDPVLDLTGVVECCGFNWESGLLGIEVDPNFLTNHYLYIYYTYRSGVLKNKVVRLVESGGTAVEDLTLLEDIPGATIHDGGRIKIGPDAKLYVGTGDATCLAAQRIDASSAALGGKILRLNLDGTAPTDNPLPEAPYVWSYGHRNVQGLAFDSSGQLYSTEHGPTGDCGWPGSSYDEVNIINPGDNYGWPVCRGTQDRLGNPCRDQGYIDPIWFSTPNDPNPNRRGTYPPSGAAFFNGSFYFGTLGFPSAAATARHIHKLTFDVDGITIVDEEILFQGGFPTGYGRIRDVVLGLDNSLYFSNSNRDGRGGDVLQPNDDRIFRVVFP